MSRRPCSAPNFFTLIEMLVVVAIVMILMSLLFPALRKAREQGLQVACAGRIHQCYLGVEMYADTYLEYLPAANPIGAWRLEILPYVMPQLAEWNGARTGYFETSNSSIAVYPKSEWAKICAENSPYRCPSTAPEAMDGYAAMSFENLQAVSGLGWNYRYLGYSYDCRWSPPDDGLPVKRTKLRDPGQTILFGDTSDDNKGGGMFWAPITLYPPQEAAWSPGPGDRHFGGINTAFADGHVEWQLREYLMNNSSLYRRKSTDETVAPTLAVWQ